MLTVDTLKLAVTITDNYIVANPDWYQRIKSDTTAFENSIGVYDSSTLKRIRFHTETLLNVSVDLMEYYRFNFDISESGLAIRQLQELRATLKRVKPSSTRFVALHLRDHPIVKLIDLIMKDEIANAPGQLKRDLLQLASKNPCLCYHQQLTNLVVLILKLRCLYANYMNVSLTDLENYPSYLMSSLIETVSDSDLDLGYVLGTNAGQPLHEGFAL